MFSERANRAILLRYAISKLCSGAQEGLMSWKKKYSFCEAWLDETSIFVHQEDPLDLMGFPAFGYKYCIA